MLTQETRDKRAAVLGVSRGVNSGRILFVSHDAGRTGAPIVLLHLMKWLRDNCQHQFRVIVRNGGVLIGEFEKLAETLVLPEPSAVFSGSRLARLARRWNPRERCDLIYSNTVTNGALVSSLAAPGVPVITHVHELGYWIDRAGAENWRQVKQQSSRFVAASRAVRETLASQYWVPEDIVDVVHDFVEDFPPGKRLRCRETRQKLGIPENAFVVGGSGLESWRKGKDLFVRLAAYERRLLPDHDVHFLWVGSAESAAERYQLDHDARLAGVTDRVHWSGEVADPVPLFSAFDALAMVSREDPFPLVCLEAALLEKPVLCFADAGGAPEFVEDDAGYVVPYLDLPLMAQRIAAMVTNRSLANTFGLRGREKVIERHTVSRAGPKILQLIDGELARSRRG